MEAARQGGFLDETDGMDSYAVIVTSSYNGEN